MLDVVRWTGIAAATAWFLLAMLTVASGALNTGTAGINAIVGAGFLAVSLHVLWRSRAVTALCRAVPGHEAASRVLRAEGVSASVLLLLGVVLLAAAGSRVLGERLPVFG
jgi:hypothetical protein